MVELNANPHWHLTKKHPVSAEIALHVLLQEAKQQYSTVPGTATVNFCPMTLALSGPTKNPNSHWYQTKHAMAKKSACLDMLLLLCGAGVFLQAKQHYQYKTA